MTAERRCGRNRGLMLGVLQSHFEVAGGSFLSWAFGLILIYAAREHSNPRFRSLLRSFQQDCGTPASSAA
jgi:hypothetical protein